jgi:xanthine dehydrogenase accessory factor
VNTHYHAQPENSVAELKANSYVVILSQDHSLDFALSLAALRRADLAFVGVIGSQTKAQRFKYRLAEQLENPALCDQLTCPIGLTEVSGKLPMQVAVSISAQLITLLEKNTDNQQSAQRKQQWQTSNSLRKQLAGEQLNE